MKNFKKILIVILVATLLFAGCVVAAFADGEYTGTLEEFTPLVENAEKSVGVSKHTAVLKLYDYLDKTPIDPAAEGYDAIIERVYAVTIASISYDLSFADVAAPDANTAYNGIFMAQEMIGVAEANLPEGHEGLAECKSKYDVALLKAANALLAKVDKDILTNRKTGENQVVINKLKRVLTDGNPYGEVDFNDIWGNLTQYIKLQEEAVALNFNDIEDRNSVSDYNLPTYIVSDLEGASVGLMPKTTTISPWTFEMKATKNPVGILMEDNGNKYMVTGYAPTDQSDKNTYIQTSLSKYSAENGYVIEFDVTTFDSIPENGLKIEAGGFDMPDGRGFPPFYLVIAANGDLVIGDAPNSSDQNKSVAIANAIVPGQWLHIVIVFNNSEFTHTLIVEGQEFEPTSAKYKGTTFDLSKGVIRFGSSGISGSIAVDNFKLYSGSGYRNPDKFNNMTDDEKFLYYTNFLGREDSKDVNGKNYAYQCATELLYRYWTWTDEEAGVGEYTAYSSANEDLKAAVDNYIAFDFDALITKVKTENLAEFIKITTELDAMVRSVETISNRSSKILEIEAFALKYSELIDKEVDSDGDGVTDYDHYNKIVANVAMERDYDKNAVLFVRHMTRFGMVSTLNSMQRYYERAKAIVNAEDASERIDIDLITNPEHPDRENFADLIAAYQTYIEAYDRIDLITRRDNSAKIINCIGFINKYVTEEEWLANYDYMMKYVNLVKDTVMNRDNNGELLYDPEYENVGECVDFFNTVYEFFYNVQQENHIEYISEVIDLISDTEAYIEKMGMVAMIDRYVATNELNYNDSRIISLLNALETCRAELQLREEDYAKLLVQNSVYFVNIVENLRTSTDYLEKKEYFNQATLYYFNIDITVVGAAEAVAIYDQCAIELELAKEASLAFIEAVDFYTTCETKEERYSALVNCYYNAQFAEKSYEGVAEALEFFENEYASYMDYVNNVNQDVSAAGAAVGSLRANCGVTSIIAIIIKKIFGV